MKLRLSLVVCVLLLSAQAAMAATFIVPSDDELIAKADAIVIGTVEGSFVREADGMIETVYEIRVERAVKGGPRAGELIRIVEPGGEIGERGVLVPGAAVYRQGERVLTFLDRHAGEWRTTDLTLGKFRFAISTRGERVLVRDTEDVVGWDHAGQVHREQVRREKEFLDYLGERVQSRRPRANYAVDASSVTLATQPRLQSEAIETTAAPFPGYTYVQWVSSTPPRWVNISAGVTFYKRSDTNISGSSDGGVTVIQNGLNAWNAECASNINLIYGGQRATPSQNHDGVNVVEFNDPQQRVSGSWSGSGTVGITFISYAGTHTFAGRTWLNITGADVVFQDGYTAANASFPSAMTHELGHGIGWRHSNQNHATKGAACNSAVEECTSIAIMNSAVSANYGYTLQPFDIHAAESVYPGGSCGPTCTPPSITAQPTSRTITSGTSTTLSVSASGTTPLSYQWYVGSSGNTGSPISGATSSSLTVSPTSTTSYWARVTNSCGSASSSTATVTVSAPPPPPPPPRVRGDYNGDGRADAVVFRPSNGTWYIRYAAGSTTAVQLGQNGDIPVPADFDGDGRTDVAVFRPSTGYWYWIPSSTGTMSSRQWGAQGDQPVPGDYDGDGRADFVIFRPSWSTWAIAYAAGGTLNIQFGESGDLAVPADYDGDGKKDIAVFRPSNGYWYWRITGGTGGQRQWGASGDQPRPADIDGDGRADFVVYRDSWKTWAIAYASGGTVNIIFGEIGDIAVPADYDGDGLDDLAVFRPSISTWYWRQSSLGTTSFRWGEIGDVIPQPR